MSDISIDCHRKLMKLSWKIIRLSRQNMAETGFAWNQYQVLKNIAPSEALTLSEISSRCRKENSNVTQLIDFLEGKGIVQRIHDKNDRRVIRVELTEMGALIREKTISSHEAFLQALYRDIDNEKLLALMELIDFIDEKIQDS